MQPIFFVWLLFFVSCGSIISSCSAWRLKHHWMVIHNDCLCSLSSTKGNLLKITFHESIILLLSSFFIPQIKIEYFARGGYNIGCVCLCECEVSQANKQYDDAINTSASVKNVVSALAYEMEMLPYGVFFTRPSSHVAHADMAAQWDVWLIRG